MADDEHSLSERKSALEAFLADAAGAESAEIAQAKPLSGGAIQENWLIDLRLGGGPMDGHHDVVLRTDAPSRVATSLSRPQEYRVLRAAWDAGVTVPEPLWLCEDAEVLGRPFYVMRHVHGVALGPKVVKDMSLGGDREALGERLGAELARIHAIKPPRQDLAFLDMPGGDPARHAVDRLRGYLDELATPQPELEWGLRWCERYAPEADETVLVHQDFRTGNYMLDEEGLTAVLDWEFAAWGAPMSDLGWFCARCWRFGQDHLEAGGVASRSAFYRGYEQASGRAVDDAAVRYWEVMAHLRWAVIALQQGARHVSGAEPSLELALTGRRVAELRLDVLEMTAPSRTETA